MEKYCFTDLERRFIEKQPTPLAVYQYVNRHVYTLALSDGFLDLFRYPERDEAYVISNQNPLNNTHPDDAARIGDAVHQFAVEEGEYDVIFRSNMHQGDDCRIVHAIGKHVYTDDGVRLAYVWFTDEGGYTEDEDTRAATLNKLFNEALHKENFFKANYYDTLTRLPNMTHFFALAEAGKASMTAVGKNAAMLYLDLNGMKYYNDSYGFAEGDKLLQAFALVLEGVFDNENCCHISADRFAVFTEEVGLKDKLLRVFSEAEGLNGGRSLPVRVGIYLSSIEEVGASLACDRAKIACDAIPKSDVSSYNYYSSRMRNEIIQRQYILSNIDRAIEEKWIQIYFQPIIRAVNEKVCDVEALARWIDPEKGFMSPAEFIPALEDAGLIYKLDLYMVEQLVEKLRLQMDAGYAVVPHSINLSRSDFDTCDIVEEIRSRVDAAGVPRDRVTIEITESIIGSDFDFIKEQVERFQSLGFPVWMDDFGSGYSSLDVLQSIKFDLLKFDMSFMRRLDEGENGKIILTELMKMATALGVDTICEGVETEKQVRFLQEIGCSKLQGYYYSKPVPLETVVKRYNEGIQVGFENQDEAAYFETIGRINLYDLAVIASGEMHAFHNSFNTIPMGILEVKGDQSRFVRSNQSYRNFIKDFFGVDLIYENLTFHKNSSTFMNNVVEVCCNRGMRSIYDERMPDGSVVHSFARRIATNPVTGNIAVAVAVLSISDSGDGMRNAEITRALVADYQSIYVVDLDTDMYTRYTSLTGDQQPIMKENGENFFDSDKWDAHCVHPKDRAIFQSVFSKAKIEQALDRSGNFMLKYRLLVDGSPVDVRMKAKRIREGGNQIIMSISLM